MNQWKRRAVAAAMAAGIIAGGAVAASAAMLDGSKPLEERTPACGILPGRLNPPIAETPREEPLLPALPEHYYDLFTYADYPAEDSLREGFTYYRAKYEQAWAAYQEAEDYYERRLRESELRAALDMMEMYRAVGENPLNGRFE